MVRLALVVAALGGCLRAADYHCAAATDCGTNGVCQPGGRCSFADPGCASGQRFGELSGSLANQCVAGGDGGTVGDGGTQDGSGDGSAAACPASYMAISGGTSGHLYRLLTTAADWQTQVTACTTDSALAYLTVPANSSELNGIRSLAAGSDVWIGIDDLATPGTYVTVNAMSPTYLPWANGQPDSTKHCVEAKGSQNRIATADCTATQLVGVCECTP